MWLSARRLAAIVRNSKLLSPKPVLARERLPACQVSESLSAIQLPQRLSRCLADTESTMGQQRDQGRNRSRIAERT